MEPLSNLVWCHKQGSFPIADFDEYEDIVRLEVSDKEDYVVLRLRGFDHSDALLATKEQKWAYMEAALEEVGTSFKEMGYWKAAMV